MSDQQERPNSSPAMVNQRPSVFKGLSSSPGFKFIITGVITFLLLIPALLVWRSLKNGPIGPIKLRNPFRKAGVISNASMVHILSFHI